MAVGFGIVLATIAITALTFALMTPFGFLLGLLLDKMLNSAISSFKESELCT